MYVLVGGLVGASLAFAAWHLWWAALAFAWLAWAVTFELLRIVAEALITVTRALNAATCELRKLKR